MVWAVLALIGVPLWLCAAGIFILLHNNRSLRTRAGNIPVRVLPPGAKRWKRGHGLWVSNVFAWRSSPAGWSEDLCEATNITIAEASVEEAARLHGLGEKPVVARLELEDRDDITVAARSTDRAALTGPFSAPTPEDPPPRESTLSR